MNAGKSKGKEPIEVLFEEMDNIGLNVQDKHHKKARKQEVTFMRNGVRSKKNKSGKGMSSFLCKFF